MKNYNNTIKDIRLGTKKTASWLPILMMLFVAVQLQSCDNFVEVDLPNSQLTSAAVFEDKATATAAMTEIYSKIRDNGLITGASTGASHLLGNYADELDFFGTPQNSAVPFYQNAIVASNPTVKDWWNATYQQIYGCNTVIEGVANASNLTSQDKQLLTGEALFTRALLHFYLTNIYGNIPYITSTNYNQNRVAGKLESTVLFSKIIDDLNKAIEVLPQDYVAPDRIRPNVFCAHALLARVYLYAGFWAEASNEASTVLNQTGVYSMAQSVEETFLKESTNTIWQVAPAFGGSNTLEAQTFNFTSGPPPLSALSPNFMMAFESGDLRKEAWTKSLTTGTTTWFHPNKYKATGTETSLEYSKIFRVEELYLIRAEARAQTGDLTGAREDLNVIRTQAGLVQNSDTASPQLLAAILRERRIELFTEFGHRFFDLKRFGALDQVLSPIKSGWNSYNRVLPIPDAELTLNPNLLPQNQGY